MRPRNQSTSNIVQIKGASGAASPQRRRITANSYINALMKRIVVPAAFVGTIYFVFCSVPGYADSNYPVLKKLLEDADTAARNAIDGDVDASCADPGNWLNSAGHSPLSDVRGLDHYNRSMLWGTYRPGVYFGLKTRTFPEAVTAGLMWHDGDGHAGIGRIRHECNEGDGLGPYGWVEHDGVSYGRQEVADDRAGVRIVTSVVKPAQLEGLEAQKHEYSDVHIAARVTALPSMEPRVSSTVDPRLSTMYLYIGSDRHGAETNDQGGMAVVETSTKPRSLSLKWTSSHLGDMEVEATAVSIGPQGDMIEKADVTMAFVGKANVPMVDVQRKLEKMHHTHRSSMHKDQTEIQARRPFFLPNTVEADSNIVLVQVTGQAPFSVDFVFRNATGAARAQASPGAVNTGRQSITADAVTSWLESGSRSFSERFRRTFSLEENGFQAHDVAAAKAALSNLLGGMGYFSGRSEVRGTGHGGRNGLSFEANLFTAVPSRSFFPRGFLWDEGFHQLLVSVWDRSISIDVLGHWLFLLHVHKESDRSGVGCGGAWLPREQILGEEARRRVPAEFIAQGIAVANPPTLLLLVDSLLQGSGKAMSKHVDVELQVCTDGASETCKVGGDEREEQVGVSIEFLRNAQPLLDEWVRWLLITQRPGAVGWGGQDDRSPLGAFQWRGRDPQDDRLNPVDLASGLDDYPRASHPSQNEEWHVDILCWLAMTCGIMKRLATVVGTHSLPYEELSNELVAGIFDLHWNEEAGTFFDYGKHISDGKVIDEAIMRCQKADGRTVDVGVSREDLETPKAICPPGHRPLFPLGDGRGGLLLRKRWRGGEPKAQHVEHIGYVSIFPLLLKLLPVDSPAIGSLLQHMRDPAELWSPHGLRSLSASDPLYQVENNPGDEPYWRGHIWVNINYMALGALRHYSTLEGPFREGAGRIYSELRANLLRTLLGSYHSTGYFWEQYDDRTGGGRRSHPFTGWTALVVLIMAEIY